METNKLISNLSCIVMDNNIVDFDTANTSAEVILCDTSDIQTTIGVVLDNQKKGYVLVVTEYSPMVSIISAINSTLTNHKISAFCKNVFYADDALIEIQHEENMLHTGDGTQFYPEVQITENLYKAEDGSLILKGDYYGEYNLSDINDSPWGFMLSREVFNEENLLGSIDAVASTLNFSMKTAIAKKMNSLLEEYHLCDSHHTLVFEHNNELYLLPISEDSVSMEVYISMLYYVYFAHALNNENKLKCLIDDRIAHPDYPSFVFTMFETMFFKDIYPNIECEAVSAELLYLMPKI